MTWICNERDFWAANEGINVGLRNFMLIVKSTCASTFIDGRKNSTLNELTTDKCVYLQYTRLLLAQSHCSLFIIAMGYQKLCKTILVSRGCQQSSDSESFWTWKWYKNICLGQHFFLLNLFSIFKLWSTFLELHNTFLGQNVKIKQVLTLIKMEKFTLATE